MTKRFLRARKPEEKELRSHHLLATARALLEQGVELNQLSLNDLARNAGMAKSNVYRYFETREALLLELLWMEWQDWYAEIQRKWARKPEKAKNLDELISLMASTISGKELLCGLTAALPGVLELNVSGERVREFKINSLNFFSEVAAQFELFCPELSAKNFAMLLQDTVTFMVGLYPFAFPNETVRKVLLHPELRFFRRDFRSELERYITAVAGTMRAKSIE